MRRMMMVLVLAVVATQPALADPKSDEDRGRGRDRDQAQVHERSRPARQGDARPLPVERSGDRSRDQGRVAPQGDARDRDAAPGRAMPPPRETVRYRQDARPGAGPRADIRPRGDGRHGDGGPGRGDAYGRGPAPPGMRVGQVHGWRPGPMPGPLVGGRGPVFVSPGFPLHRAPRMVFVRRHPDFWGPIVYWGPTFYFHARFVPPPPPDRLAWEDSAILYRSEGWTDFSLDVNDYGGGLFLEVSGSAQVDWAEVVFNDGRARVVDFDGGVLGSGVYSLLDFRGERDVAYVRLVGRAMSPRARVSLSMSRW